MPALTPRQITALVQRATFTSPAPDRFHKGIRDASAALAKILTEHRGDRFALRRALDQFVIDGPVWDSESYTDGQACVVDDVAAVLDNYAEVIDELLRQAAEAATTTTQGADQ